MFVGGQAITALTRIELGLPDPPAERLEGDAKLLRGRPDGAIAGAGETDCLGAEFRGVGWIWVGASGPSCWTPCVLASMCPPNRGKFTRELAGNQFTHPGTGRTALSLVRCGEGLFDLQTGKPVRLTAMHLDGDPMNCEEWNLVTACRPCHATYDAPERVIHNALSRKWIQIEAGQLDLFLEVCS